MNDTKDAFARLAGILKATQRLLEDSSAGELHRRPIGNFRPQDVELYFQGAERQLQILREQIPALYGDFPHLQLAPATEMAPGAVPPKWFSRAQLTALARDIEQVFEMRAHSELASPDTAPSQPRVFISHGRAADWREVQAYIERDLGIKTIELAQEANRGRTVLQKLEQESNRCTSAVIVMTGDDTDAAGKLRARENVVHEFGYFQGKFGFSAVCLLYEEGTELPSNIHGLV